MQQETGTHAPLEHAPRPITPPWAIEACGRLGDSFLKYIFWASISRRQTAFAVLARWGKTPEAILAQAEPFYNGCAFIALGELLQTGCERTLIEAAYGSCPDGYRSGQKFLGPDAFADPQTYAVHHSLYADRANRQRLKVAQQMGHMNDERIQVLFLLPPPLLRPQFVRRVATLETAKAVTAAYEAVLYHAAPEAIQSITAAAHDAPEEQPIHKMIQTWVRHARFPPPPVEADYEVGFLTASSAAEQTARATRFQNCSGGLNRLIAAILGKVAYVAYEPGGVPTAMVSLIRIKDGNGSWLIDGIFGHANVNSRITPEVRATVVEWFAARGIHGIDREPLPKPWETVLALAGHRRAFFDLQDEAEFPEELG